MSEHPSAPPEPQRVFVATPGRSVSYNLAAGVVRPALILDVHEELQAVDLMVFLKSDDAAIPTELDRWATTGQHDGAVVGSEPGTWFPSPVVTATGDVLDWTQVWFLPAAVPELQEAS